MTAQQIADVVEGIIPLCIGVYGLTILSKNPKVSPGFRKALKPLSIILIAIGVLFTAKPFFNARQAQVDYGYVVRKINERTAGTYIDETTRMDSIVLGPDNAFIYNITVTHVRSTETDTLSRESLKATMTENLQDNPQAIELLKKGIPIVVRFFGSDSILITEIKLEPDAGKHGGQ